MTKKEEKRKQTTDKDDNQKKMRDRIHILDTNDSNRRYTNIYIEREQAHEKLL